MVINQSLLDPQQAANFLGMSFKTLARWRSEGRGPTFIKLNNGVVRYSTEDLLEYVDSYRVTANQS